MKGLLIVFLLITGLAACAKKPVQVAANESARPVAPKTDTPKTPTPTDTAKTPTTPVPAIATSITITSNSPGNGAANAFNYLALGDSYTIGESVPLDQSFPYQLAAELNKQIKVNTPTIVARTGWITNDLLQAISNTSGKTNYDFVTLLIGVNDQYQNVGQNSYQIAFTEALGKAIALAKNNKSRVFVLSIPDYSVTPYAANTTDPQFIANEIDGFNAINKFESDKAGVNYLNITDISRHQAATDRTLIANDGLHPSGKMYALWVERLAPLILAKLNK